MAFIGTNLIGLAVRGVLWTRPSMDAPTDRVAALIARESRRMSMANVLMTALSLVFAAVFLLTIHYFFGIGAVIAACAIIASRVPDLLWEIRSGERLHSQNAPSGAILFWGALPLLWYALCAQSQ